MIFEMTAATSAMAMTAWIAVAESVAPIVHFNIRLMTSHLQAMSDVVDEIEREPPKPLPRSCILALVA